MKTLLFLFLFCFPILTTAQRDDDSLYYYYYVINEPNQKSDLPAAIAYFRKYKTLSLKNKDTLSAIYASRMIAQATYFVGNIYLSEQEAVHGLQLVGDKEGEVYDNHRMGLFTQLGMVYRNIKDYHQAIKIYDKALLFNPNTKAHINLLNNKANTFKSLEEFDQAEEILQQALTIAQQVKDTMSQALLLDNLGEVQHRLGNSEAIHSLQKALYLRKQSTNLKQHFRSYVSLADYYFLSYPDSSKYYANQALTTAESLRNIAYKKEALHLLLRKHTDPRVREHIELSDSLHTVSLIEDNKFAYRKWNIAEAKKKQELAEIEKENERSMRLMYQWIGLLLVVIATLLFYLFKIRHKRDRIREVYRTEARIAKKVHDEVANDIHHLMNTLQHQTTTQVETVDSLELLYNKTRNISKEISSIALGEAYEIELKELLENYQCEQLNIITRNLSNIVWTTISDEKKLTLFRVLQELMTNMKKHSEASLVAIQFFQEGNKLRIEYSDNGKGTQLIKGNGLRNTENRMESINGSINFESSPNYGFKAILAL